MRIRFTLSSALWTVLGITILEAVAMVAFHRLHQKGDAINERLARMQIWASQLNALEWRAIAQGNAAPEITEEITRVRDEIAAAGLELRQGLWKVPILVEIRRNYHLYVAAVNEELDLLRQGRLEQARKLDEQRVDPAFEALQQSLNNARHYYESVARRFYLLDMSGSLVTLAGAAGVVLFLFRRFAAFQTLQGQLEAERRIVAAAEKTAHDIRELNNSLEARVRERTESLASVNERLAREMQEREHLENLLQRVSESEKQRLGQDLHDGLAQILTGAAMRGKALEQRLLALQLPEAADLRELTETLAAALRNTRDLAGMLHPLNLSNSGLAPALRDLAARLRAQPGLDASFAGPEGLEPADEDAAAQLYRIAQEAAANAVRHGAAAAIRITLRRLAGGLELAVENDGPPVPDREGLFDGMGCRIMKYRARIIRATLDFQRPAAGGCRVACQWVSPLPAEGKEAA